MAVGTPNFTGSAPRKLLVVAIDINKGIGTPDYRILGRRTPDSSISTNTTIETETDILGFTDTDVTNMQPTQDMTWPLNAADYDLSAILMDIYRRRAFNEFAGWKVLEIHAFEGTSGNYPAIESDNSTLELSEMGGSGEGGRIMLSVTLHIGGVTTEGTVDTAVFGSSPVFTPTV